MSTLSDQKQEFSNTTGQNGLDDFLLAICTTRYTRYDVTTTASSLLFLCFVLSICNSVMPYGFIASCLSTLVWPEAWFFYYTHFSQSPVHNICYLKSAIGYIYFEDVQSDELVLSTFSCNI